MIIAALLGSVAWTFAEYVLHRWLGHSPSSAWEFAREHREHHRQRQYFSPWVVKLRLAVVVLGVMLLVVPPLLGLNALVFFASFLVTWLVYEAIHRDLHVRAPLTAVGRFLRRHHLRHHHVDTTTNHGVSSPVWDLAFGTLRPSGRVRIAAGKTPYWLANAPAAAPYLADYEIVGRPSAS